MTFEEYESEVKKHLTEKRFYHSRCVSEEAVMLAKRYGADVEKARIAGILHDIMKDTPGQEQLKIIEESGILLSDVEKRNPKLWHAIAGAAYAERYLGVTDREILDAIRCHTNGKAGMSLLDKVLYIADYNSADRTYPGVDEMRRLAEKSLEDAMLMGISYTLNELCEQRMPIDPGAVHAYNEALEVVKNKERT